MPNNFKIQGDYYVSKFGNDSWDGLTPDTPKRTVQAGLNLMTVSGRTLVIGNGVYNETISYTQPNGHVNTLRGDGKVVLEGTGTNRLFIGGAVGNHQLFIDNIEIRNYLAFDNGSVTALVYISNCIIKRTNLYFNPQLGGLNLDNCTLIECSIFSINPCLITKCVLVNCSGGTVGINPFTAGTYGSGVNNKISTMLNCSSVKCNFSFNNNITTANLNYNNFQDSVLIMNLASVVTSGVIQDTYGRYYDLSIATSTGDGTVGNPYGRPYTNGTAFNYANHKVAYPTYNVNSSAVDPQFNDILAQDFTLRSTSPLIGRGSDGIINIGGTRSAIRAAANSSSFSGSGATVDSGLTFSYDNYVISGSAVTGSVTSAPIFISSSAKVIQDIEYNGLLAFNKTTSSFFYSGSNVNVPDFDTYTSASGNPGANPDRLVYYMRLTTGSTQPAVDADWDNGNLWTRGDYNVFEWNTKPSIDIYGRGNGDPNFVVANSSFLRATYIQMKVKLRNDYLQ